MLVLERPPGRTPKKDIVEVSAFFLAMDPAQRELIKMIIEQTAGRAVFGMLAVLDGVRIIDQKHGEFVLTYRHDGEESVLTLKRGEMLHELL
jgi:hypothetical protein